MAIVSWAVFIISLIVPFIVKRRQLCMFIVFTLNLSLGLVPIIAPFIWYYFTTEKILVGEPNLISLIFMPLLMVVICDNIHIRYHRKNND